MITDYNDESNQTRKMPEQSGHLSVGPRRRAGEVVDVAEVAF